MDASEPVHDSQLYGISRMWLMWQVPGGSGAMGTPHQAIAATGSSYKGISKNRLFFVIPAKAGIHVAVMLEKNGFRLSPE